MFGLTGAQANHGEDAKEYWWYLDALPSHAWNRWRYHYPQAAFPYEDLVQENGRRSRHDPEYELLDTGVFDEDRYWIVEVHYAKADPHDLLMHIQVTNAGPDADTAARAARPPGSATPGRGTSTRPSPGSAATGPRPSPSTIPFLGEPRAARGSGPRAVRRRRCVFCENETNDARLYGRGPTGPYPKDGINDHVVSGAPTVNPEQHGTKCACLVHADGASRARRSSCACACAPGAPTPSAPATPWAPISRM